MSFLNRVGFETATTGAGTMDVDAALTGYATPAEAGAGNGVKYSYVIEDGDDFEIGEGTYLSSGPTLSRDTVRLSKIGGSAGTTKITLSGSARVYLTATAEDLSFSELYLSMSMLALQVSDNTNVALFPSSNRVADSFDVLTYVDTGAATNLDSGTAGLLKPSASDAGAISGGTGTNIGDFSAGAGLSAVFNGDTSEAAVGAAAAKATTTSGYVGKNYSAAPKRIYSAVVHGTTDRGFVNAINPTVTLTLYGKNGGAPANATDGTSIGSTSFTEVTDESAGRTVNASDSATAWDYVWVVISHNGAANAMYCVEVVFHEAGTANLTVASTAISAAAAPAVMKGVFLVKEVEAGVAGTDYSIEFSRNNGTDWTTATLTELFISPSPEASIVVVQTNDVNVSGQSSGTLLRWRFKTLTNKIVELRAAHMYWS